MITYVSISLLILGGIVIPIIIWWTKDETVSTDLYILGRAGTVLVGVALPLLGISFYQRQWPLAGFFGPMLIVIGLQIFLWAIGIRSEWLGNAEREYREADFEERPMNFVEGEQRTELMKILQLQRRKSDVSYHLEKLRIQEQVERVRIPYAKLYGHLIVLIGILKYAEASKEETKINLLYDAFQSEINAMLNIIGNDTSVMFTLAHRPYIEKIAVLRFFTINAAIEKLEMLEKFAETLRYYPES
jgi:hypothetical protein